MATLLSMLIAMTLRETMMAMVVEECKAGGVSSVSSESYYLFFLHSIHRRNAIIERWLYEGAGEFQMIGW